MSVRMEIIWYFCRKKRNEMRVVIEGVREGWVRIEGICKWGMKEGLMIVVGIVLNEYLVKSGNEGKMVE